MHPILNQNLFLVKEQVRWFRTGNNFDIYDPNTGELILNCREDQLGFFARIFRFTDYKRMTPFHIQVRTPLGEPVVSVKRGIALFFSKVDVLDEEDFPLGGFQQKLSIGGKFEVLGASGQSLCTLVGKWTGWDFRFMAGDTEIAHVSKKWAGLGKELFTSADNYVLSISEAVPPDNPIRQLILAAVLSIDMVLKE